MTTESTQSPREELADRTRELMVLNAIAAAVAESLEPKPLLASALDHVLDLLEFDAGAIYTRDANQLHMMVHRDIPLSLAAQYAVLRLDQPYISQMVDEHRSLAANLAASQDLQTIASEGGFQSLLGLPLFARGELAGVLIVLRRNPNGFRARERALLEASADHIALALDNARLFAAEQLRHKQAEALRKGALALTEALGPDDVLRRIVEQATDLMESPMCAIFEYDQETNALVIRSTGDRRRSPRPQDPSIPFGRHIVESAISERHAVCVPDVYAPDARRQYNLDGEALPFRSALAAPLLVKGHAYGGIVVFYPELRNFRADEVQLIDIFADQAALALEHARLVDQSRDLAALEERQRIARDLHDSVSQTLFSLNLAAQAARTTVETDAQAAAAMLATVQELASGALAEMRALIFELRPGALREAGLAAAIDRFVGAFKSRTGIQVTLTLDQRRLPNTVEEALYRITGEALNNVHKHAGASHVAITLQRIEASVQLHVADNGVGFAVDQPITGDHMGQRSMRERATAIGGTCRVQSSPGAGTTVIVEAPLDPDDER